MAPPPMAAESNNGAAVTAAVHPAGPHPRRRHVLLFPLPYQGHINPMFRLAGVLHARGFAITVFHTSFNAPDPARHPQYRFVPVPDGISGPAPVAIEDVVARIIALGPACEPAFRDRLAAVLDEYSRSGDAVACLVADAHLLPVFQVATSMALPALALRTGSAASYACFAAYPMLCDRGYLPVQDSELDMLVPELPPYRVRDLMQLGKGGHGLIRELLARAVAAVEASSGLILNTFDALEHGELAGIRLDLAAAVPVFDVGPLHKLSPAAAGDDSSLLRQDRACLEWLDAQPRDSVLYVSFGSLACMTPRDLAETAWGIAGSGVPFLWVVRPGLVRGACQSQHHNQQQLPEGFEAATFGRGMVVAWAPQEDVLRHRAVGGFWTHNGWNSTMESVCEGVPMLCRPYFGDQPGNVRYVEHVWRVGFEVGGELERGTVKEAIRRLMTSADGAEMRARAGELKKAAAECIGKGGSSCLAIDKLVTHIMSLDSTRGEAASLKF
ncbi:DIMBOA UDP-glucosyltransferase BX8-like [Miscanthus floridulus]|uniref:DIMBOA UDP-glucosyltransferase BX8-like n=1 Tax=Miscanthus floridulus TaxID=154761 RepID=UPI00345A7C6D